MAKAYFGAPFSRALDYNHSLGEFIRNGMQLFEAIEALGGPYESRDHGRGRRSGVRVKAENKMLAQRSGTPRQGQREIARRLRQQQHLLNRQAERARRSQQLQAQALYHQAYDRLCSPGGVAHG